MIVGIIGNTTKPETVHAVRLLRALLDDRAIAYVLDEDLVTLCDPGRSARSIAPAVMREEASVVIAFGGDGTMLATGRMLAGSGVPLLGVNLGKLGFLAEFSLNEVQSAVDDFVAGRCRIVERSLLEATFPDVPGLEPMLGLNDIVIDKRDGSLMLRLDTRVNGDYLGTYNSDGLIVATPTGSTAYALAVGGPVVVPSARVLVVAPIAPHMLTARPVVLSDASVIEIRPQSHRAGEDVRVLADGQVERLVPLGSCIRVTRHAACVSLVKRTSTTYFDVLRAKLLWGIEPALNIGRPATGGES